jgi:hypothetical protein
MKGSFNRSQAPQGTSLTSAPVSTLFDGDDGLVLRQRSKSVNQANMAPLIAIKSLSKGAVSVALTARCDNKEIM